MGSALTAFSGGADSSYLAWAAQRALGARHLAVFARGSLSSDGEEEECTRVARSIGAELVFVEVHDLGSDTFRTNPPDRCYHCKRSLLEALKKIASDYGIGEVCTGDNADDASCHRPGRRAVEELGARTPLAEARLTKGEIRLLSERAGLSTAWKPSMACLASRIPHGTAVTAERLRRVALGESFLRGRGLRVVRLRDHGPVCRIETDTASLAHFHTEENLAEVVEYLKSIGFRYVTLDLEGYRSGSMDEV